MDSLAELWKRVRLARISANEPNLVGMANGCIDDYVVQTSVKNNNKNMVTKLLIKHSK